MLVNDVTTAALRGLADHENVGKVLSVFVDLDPSQFGTRAARATMVNSVLDRASHAVEQAGAELGHDAREALKADLERVRSALESDLDLSGARGLAIFAAGRSDLFEVLRLPAGIDHDPVVGDAPYLEPVAGLGHDERWAVLLANRQSARLLWGSRDTLIEIALVESDVHGQHQQGGWSQARYQRSVDMDVKAHLKDVAEIAFARLQRRLPAGILLATPEEMGNDLEEHLHPYLRERVVGKLSLDVEHSTADEVRGAAAEVIDEAARAQEDELLERLKEGLARSGPQGRAAAGLPAVLEALTEQRVEVLLLDDGTTHEGVVCPQCGWLGVEGDECPADGTPTEHRDDILPDAVDRALTQSARVVVLRDRPDLGSHEHVAAILRY